MAVGMQQLQVVGRPDNGVSSFSWLEKWSDNGVSSFSGRIMVSGSDNGVGRIMVSVHFPGSKNELTPSFFAMCLLLYNLIQVVRGVIAVDVQRPREEISGEKLFEDVERQMIAWSETVEPEETIAYFKGEWTALRVKVRLSELLRACEKNPLRVYNERRVPRKTRRSRQ